MASHLPDFLTVYSDQEGNLAVEVSDSWESGWQRVQRYIQAHGGTEIKLTLSSLAAYGTPEGIMPQAATKDAEAGYASAYCAMATLGMDIGPGGGADANQAALPSSPARFPGRLLLWTNPVTHAPVWQTLVRPAEDVDAIIQSQTEDVIDTSPEEGPAELRVFNLVNYGPLNLEGYHGIFGSAAKEL